MSSNEDRIAESIAFILGTAHGERVMRPTFGSGAMQLVFAPNSPELASTTQFLIAGALNQWLGELIEVREVSVTSDDATLRIVVAEPEKWHPLLGDVAGGNLYLTLQDTGTSLLLGVGGEFHSSTSYNKTGPDFQSDNIDDNLRAQGITGGSTLASRYSISSDLGGRIVGFAALASDGDVLWLKDCWVLPAEMGRGVGRALFRHAQSG